MGSSLALRRRIKSAKSISQITKAMEMVSASKMKKAQDQALQSRPFTDKLREMIGHVSLGTTTKGHPLTTPAVSPTKILVVIISTNKGLCGALNVNLYKGLLDWIKLLPSSTTVDLVSVGKKSRTYIPNRDTKLIASFNELGETVTFEETRSISTYLIKSFTDKLYDEVYILYPKFISTLKNDVTITKLLPIAIESAQDFQGEYQLDGSKSNLIDSLLPYEVEMTLYQTILESRASEHSARMVAMKNASDNARDLIGNLTLVYNQARQTQVTSELLDVTTARMALE